MTRVTDSVSKPSTTIKFLYSYNGKILPRHTDATLRYTGGHTRVLSVNRSVSYSELLIKFYEACGFSVTVKCKLPSEDLDVLVTVSSDEELDTVIEEYERVSPEAKIRVVLVPVSSVKSVSPVPSLESLVEYSANSKRVACPRRQCSVTGSSRFSRECNVQGLNKKQLVGR